MDKFARPYAHLFCVAKMEGGVVPRRLSSFASGHGHKVFLILLMYTVY